MEDTVPSCIFLPCKWCIFIYTFWVLFFSHVSPTPVYIKYVHGVQFSNLIHNCQSWSEHFIIIMRSIWGFQYGRWSVLHEISSTECDLTLLNPITTTIVQISLRFKQPDWVPHLLEALSLIFSYIILFCRFIVQNHKFVQWIFLLNYQFFNAMRITLCWSVLCKLDTS